MGLVKEICFHWCNHIENILLVVFKNSFDHQKQSATFQGLNHAHSHIE
jgi:hypothetical protein